MQFPAFLLRKLYVKGSLENTGDGFSFKIKNTLSPGTAIGVLPVKVDEVEYPLETTIVRSEDVEIIASEIGEDNTFPIKVGVEITVQVDGNALPEGAHKIDIGLQLKGIGKLAFDVEDTI